MAAPKKVDYERIEPGWRAGIKSPEQLAAEYTAETGNPVSRQSICKHFRKVPRDLTAKVHAAADAMVAAAKVAAKGAAATETATIEASAEVEATVRIEHNRNIVRARTLCMAMFAELEASTANTEALREIGEMLRDPDDGKDRLNDIYQAVLSLPERSKTLKTLAESLKTLIGLERENLGIGTDSSRAADAFESLLDLAAK